MSKAVWLHLSDWHQRGRELDRKAVRDALLEDLEKRESIDKRLAEIDFIVFSGDLAFNGAAEEYTAAAEELLTPVLKVTRVPKNRLFIVPGNHDLERRTQRLLGSWLKLFETSAAVNEALMDARERAVLLQPFESYAQFVRGFWGVDAMLEPAYSFLAPFEVRGVRFAILGMSSAWMCGQHVENGRVADYGHLILGEPQYHDAVRLPTFKEANVRVGVLHHPFSWLSEVISRREVEQSLAQACHFLLRGHEHEARVTIPSGPEGNCAILSAGAAYDRRDYPNGYNFVHLDLAAGRGTVFLRRYDRLGGFHMDVVTSGDITPGFHRFVLPKDLGKEVIASVRVPAAARRRDAEPALIVELVTDHRSPDILAALELYDNRIPEGERFEAMDIMRWLRDRQAENYFFVAKHRSHVCGVALVHVRPSWPLAFIAYLVAEKKRTVDDRAVSSYLMEEVAKLFSVAGECARCEAILLEVDDPRQAATERERQLRIARIRLFCVLAEREKFNLRALDFDYRQPLLRVPAAGENGQEIPMVLMVAERQRPDGGGSHPRQRVEGFLDFIYRWLYPAGFSEIDAQNEAYSRYLDELYSAQVASLADCVPTLGLAQIRARSRAVISRPALPKRSME
jgi:Calcineurin-like phosphoesterase